MHVISGRHEPFDQFFNTQMGMVRPSWIDFASYLPWRTTESVTMFGEEEHPKTRLCIVILELRSRLFVLLSSNKECPPNSSKKLVLRSYQPSHESMSKGIRRRLEVLGKVTRIQSRYQQNAESVAPEFPAESERLYHFQR